MTKYSCKKIEHLLYNEKPRYSWRAIARYYNITHPAPYIWYNSHCKKTLKKFSYPYLSPLDPNAWAKYYCGYTWRTKYLDKLTQLLLEALRQLIFLPRGTGKSLRSISVLSEFVLEEREPVVVITSGPASKMRLFDAFRLILNSERVRHDYGELFSSFDSNKCTVKLKPELKLYSSLDPVLRVCSRNADIIGSHAKWYHLEDIVQEEFRSEESNEALIRWFEDVISWCATHEEGKETKITSTGTRKSKKDFYNHLIKKLHYPSYTRKALRLIDGIYPSEEDITYGKGGIVTIDLTKGTYKDIGCPNWPLTKLLIEKIKKPTSFRTNMQNEPVDPEGNYFKAKNFKYVKWERTKDSQFVIAVDPAFGKSESADNTAIIVMARDKSNPHRYIIVEVFAAKIQDIKTILDDIYHRWSPGVVSVVMESNYLQKIFVLDKLNQELAFAIGEFWSRGEKILRIQSLSDPFLTKIRVWDKCIGRTGLYDEYISFVPQPSTKSRKDDRLDATQMCYETWVRIAGYSMPASGRTSSDFEEARQSRLAGLWGGEKYSDLGTEKITR